MGDFNILKEFDKAIKEKVKKNFDDSFKLVDYVSIIVSGLLYVFILYKLDFLNSTIWENWILVFFMSFPVIICYLILAVNINRLLKIFLRIIRK